MKPTDDDIRLRRIEAWFTRQNYHETRNHNIASMQQQVYQRLLAELAVPGAPARLEDRVAAIWARGWQPVRIVLANRPAPPVPAQQQRGHARQALKRRMQARRSG